MSRKVYMILSLDDNDNILEVVSIYANIDSAKECGKIIKYRYKKLVIRKSWVFGDFPAVKNTSEFLPLF